MKRVAGEAFNTNNGGGFAKIKSAEDKMAMVPQGSPLALWAQRTAEGPDTRSDSLANARVLSRNHSRSAVVSIPLERYKPGVFAVEYRNQGDKSLDATDFLEDRVERLRERLHEGVNDNDDDEDVSPEDIVMDLDAWACASDDQDSREPEYGDDDQVSDATTSVQAINNQLQDLAN